jgi:hypothetical protein
MRYFKDDSGQLYADPIEKNHTTLVEIDESEFNDILAARDIQTGEQKIAAMTTVAQAALDAQAQSMGYDSIFTAATYTASTNPIFLAEAVALVAWRDTVWEACHDLLSDWQGGGAEPTEADVLSALPVYEAP